MHEDFHTCALKTWQQEIGGTTYECPIDSDAEDKYLLFCNDQGPGTF